MCSDASEEQGLDELLEMQIEKALGGIMFDSDTKAPIILPTNDELAVRVIPIATINRLSEVTADSELVTGILWTCIGGLLGVIANMVASDHHPNKSEWMLSAILAILSVSFFLFSIRFRDRTKQLIRHINKSETAS